MRLSYKWVNRDEFDRVYKALHPKIFTASYHIPLTPVLTPEEVHERHRSFNANAFFNLVVYDGTHPVAYSQSVVNYGGRLHMRQSGVLPRYRRKGIYAQMLRKVIARAKKEGLGTLTSNHHITNNAIIIAKLKSGFTVSGLQQTPESGLLLQLVYYINPSVDKLYRFRAGATQLDKKLAKRLKTNPLR